MIDNKNLIFLLKKWFNAHKRPFPWREKKTPYRVFVSETMLQQTRAHVVVPYFEKWMKKFPDFSALSNADEREVLKTWEGLGYYTRAKNLHYNAMWIMEKYKGVFPEEKEKIEELKGVGPYMLGALLSFAFDKKKAAIDGNVVRVITRLFAIKQLTSRAATKRLIEKKAQDLIDQSSFCDTPEALIELGALVCQKKPKCFVCPLSNFCQAKQENIENELPILPTRTPIEKHLRLVCVFSFNEMFLVRKESKALMKDLYHFFYHDSKSHSQLVKKREKVLSFWKRKIQNVIPLDSVSQSFTKYRLTLFPYLIILQEKIDLDEYIWIPKKDIKDYPFSSGPRKILESINAHSTS